MSTDALLELHGPSSRSGADPQGESAGRPLPDDAGGRTDACWRPCTCPSVGQVELQDAELLRRPLARTHIGPRLSGRRGTGPGLAVGYADVSALIRRTGQVRRTGQLRRTGQQSVLRTGPGRSGIGRVGVGRPGATRLDRCGSHSSEQPDDMPEIRNREAEG